MPESLQGGFQMTPNTLWHWLAVQKVRLCCVMFNFSMYVYFFDMYPGSRGKASDYQYGRLFDPTCRRS